MKRLIPPFLALILFGLLVYIGIQQDKHGYSEVINKPVPDISLQTPEGKKINLGDFKGKVVLINFWATWCPPCREEFILFKEIYEKYKDRGFEIIAVNTDPENLKDFLKEHELPFIVVVANDEALNYFNPQGLPTSYLVNREGIIVKKRLGIYRELEKDIKDLL
ncbi:hypothetical protein JCM9492_12230 [Aquifex pyrophilus]